MLLVSKYQKSNISKDPKDGHQQSCECTEATLRGDGILFASKFMPRKLAYKGA